MLVLWVLCVLFVSISRNSVSAEHGVVIYLSEIVVSGNLNNSQPCSPYTGLDITCSPRPKICIQPGTFPNNDQDQCSTGPYIDLGVFENTLQMKFSEYTQYGGWRNPNVFIFWGDFPSYYTVKLIIWNADGTNYQPIGYAQWNFTTDTGPGNKELETKGNIESVTLQWDHYPPSTFPSISPSPDFFDDAIAESAE